MTTCMLEFDSTYSYTLAPQDPEQWHALIAQFDDVTLFQTTPFAAAKGGPQTIEHLALHRGNQPVAAAQVRLIRVPLTRRSIAYVLWGPLFRRGGTTTDWNVLRCALSALRQEYVVKRGLSLRVTPLFTREEDSQIRPIFERAGFRY